MQRWAILALLAVAATGVANAADTCDARKFGAKADGVTMDTAAIQAAIDSCAKKGGGTVVLTSGTYLSAPIVLRSHITLNLAKGATLLGSSNHADYPDKTEMRNPGKQSLVSATNAEDLAITGEGTIDGAGESWWKEARAQDDKGIMGVGYVRPRLIVFDHCKHIRMEGVTVKDSPFWQIVPYYSDDIVIRHIKVLAASNSPNTDGIDPFASTHVTIDNVFADVGDDDIAIKSGQVNSPGPDSPSAYITITHCTFWHGHGISVGSEIAGGAQHVLADDIHFKGTDNGVRVKANRDRGNDVSDIVFKNIVMEDVRTPILISEYYPHMLPESEDKPQPLGRLTPYFHDITLENLTATGATNAGVVIGLPESPVKSVTLKNVTISAKKAFIIANADVTTSKFAVTVPDGPPVKIDASAKVTEK